MILRTRKSDTAEAILFELTEQSSLAGQDYDGMRMIQLLSGVLVETLLLFDDPDFGLEDTYEKIAKNLQCEPFGGELGRNVLPPAYIVDYETENGRAMAKTLFENWLTCPHEFHEIVIFVIQHIFIRMEEEGHPRQEAFRLFIEMSNRAMGYEIAAQELCDIMIEHKISKSNWSLQDSISGLGAISGQYLAVSENACAVFKAPVMPDKLDQLTYVMTQEAVRLGVPAGTDWRFGLAANDCPVSAPFELIQDLDPLCQELFKLVSLSDVIDQAVACAKAAGRMLAIASGGEEPEIEPVIGKPLTIGAMTDTYKTVCQGQSFRSYQ